MTSKTQPDAATLLHKTVDKLRIDSAWLRMNSRDETDAEAARMLETAAGKVFRVSNALEKLTTMLGK